MISLGKVIRVDLRGECWAAIHREHVMNTINQRGNQFECNNMEEENQVICVYW